MKKVYHVTGSIDELISLQETLYSLGYENINRRDITFRSRTRVIHVYDNRMAFVPDTRTHPDSISYKVFMETTGRKFKNEGILINKIINKNVPACLLNKEMNKYITACMIEFYTFKNGKDDND